jgi:hypothetical protein
MTRHGTSMSSRNDVRFDEARTRPRLWMRRLCLIAVMLLAAPPALPAQAKLYPFQFEAFPSVELMQIFLQQHFPLGSDRNATRDAFVSEGRATLIAHPTRAGVEKYIYDINLCSTYVWRWNISADYDPAGHLLQLFLNGNPVFADGKGARLEEPHTPAGKKASIYSMQRPRPEASKGESSLAFIVYDADSDLQTTDDQVLMGGGPSRADPSNMGQMVVYKDVDPWRSIFDSDAANFIAPYSGGCS